jgi:hypothetical protein
LGFVHFDTVFTDMADQTDYELAESMLFDSSSSSSSSESSSSSDEESEILDLTLRMLPKTQRELVKRVLDFETKYVAQWNNEEVFLNGTTNY